MENEEEPIVVPELLALEQHAARRRQKAELEDLPAIDVAEDELDVEEMAIDLLRSASETMRNAAVLLEYLANPDFCKGLTKRERGIIEQQFNKLWTKVVQVDEAVENLEAAACNDDDEDDDEDEDDDI